MTPRRWLVVVQRERAALLASLLACFDQRFVEVILDRRQGERRTSVADTAAERRRGDRRRAPSSLFRLAREGDGFQVFERDGRMLVRCGEWGETIEYEMPHFREPPARLEVAVLHVRKAVTGAPRSEQGTEVYVQHSAEIQAFSASGRPLLSCCLYARPPRLLGHGAGDDLMSLRVESEAAGLPPWIQSR